MQNIKIPFFFTIVALRSLFLYGQSSSQILAEIHSKGTSLHFSVRFGSAGTDKQLPCNEKQLAFRCNMTQP